MRRLELLEQRRLSQVVADVKADTDQDGTQDERHAPAPGQEGVFGKAPSHEREHRIGEQKSDRCGQLDHASQHAAPLSPGVDLVHHDRRTSPLSTQSQALNDAQENEEDGCHHAHGGIRRQESDGKCGKTHHQ